VGLTVTVGLMLGLGVGVGVTKEVGDGVFKIFKLKPLKWYPPKEILSKSTLNEFT
jgi:hypothetical protein